MTDQELRLECVKLAVEHVGGKFSPDEIVNAAKAIYGFVIASGETLPVSILGAQSAAQAQQFQGYNPSRNNIS